MRRHSILKCKNKKTAPGQQLQPTPETGLLYFTIADGQLPSNTGAGYVIRRILRRAVRYYYSYLDYQQPLLFQLLPVIAEQFADVFPELKQQQDFVGKVIREEEDAFLRIIITYCSS